MSNEFILVKKSTLPLSIQEFLKAKKLVDEKNYSVSEACREVGISRSTFYKYSEEIFEPSEKYGKKACILIKALNSKGILSSILNTISNKGGNILTINQDLPIHEIAYISILIDIIDLELPLDELIQILKITNGVKKVEILSFE